MIKKSLTKWINIYILYSCYFPLFVDKVYFLGQNKVNIFIAFVQLFFLFFLYDKEVSKKISVFMCCIPNNIVFFFSCVLIRYWLLYTKHVRPGPSLWYQDSWQRSTWGDTLEPSAALFFLLFSVFVCKKLKSHHLPELPLVTSANSILLSLFNTPTTPNEIVLVKPFL